MKRTLVLTAAVVLGFTSGCKQSAPPATQPVISKYTQSAIAAGGHLNSDGTVTNANGSITQPDGNVVAASQTTNSNAMAAPAQTPTQTPTQQPVNSAIGAAPAGSMPYPATRQPMTQAAGSSPTPVRYTAPAGTPVTIRTSEQLSASQDEVGTRFHAVLDRPVVTRGYTIFKAGESVEGTVVASKGKGRFKGAGALGIELVSIGRTRVSTSEYEVENKGRGKRTGAFAGGGAGLGAIIGGIAGGGKGALIGGLAGAGGGTAAGAYTGNRDVIIRPESVITFRLTESVSR